MPPCFTSAKDKKINHLPKQEARRKLSGSCFPEAFRIPSSPHFPSLRVRPNPCPFLFFVIQTLVMWLDPLWGSQISFHSPPQLTSLGFDEQAELPQARHVDPP
jgi:hypothetical protein